MRIDSHQHFWNYVPSDYSWITEKAAVLKRDFMPEDLKPLLDRHGLDGAVAVQARQNLEESRWLLELADRHSFIKAVVGWVDLRDERVDDQLQKFAAHPKFAGVRHIVQDEPDDQFLLQPNFVRGLKKLKAFGLTYDLLVFPKQLPGAIELVRQMPDQPFVLDHIAKPFIRDGTIAPWESQIRELAPFPNVLCKVSGMVTEARWGDWKAEDFKPYLDIVFEAFGEDRLMFGSDWPVCLLSGSYDEVFGLVANYLGQFTISIQEKILGKNAAAFYGIRG